MNANTVSIHQSVVARCAPPSFNRRNLLKMAGLSVVAVPMIRGFGTVPAIAAEEGAKSLNRFPRMVHDYFVHQVRQADRRNRLAYEGLKSRAEAEQYVRDRAAEESASVSDPNRNARR